MAARKKARSRDAKRADSRHPKPPFPKQSRVNCVAPGPIWTPLNVADKPAPKAAKHGAERPMERPGQPEEVAPSYVFFASNADSSYITGEVLTLLGGETAAV